VVAGVPPALLFREHPVHRRSLRGAVLDGDEPVGTEQPPRRALHGLDGVEAIRSAPQRGGRVVLADFGLDVGPHRDVRRVADHEVNRTVELAERVAEVARVQQDAPRRVRGALHVAGDVALGPGPGDRVGLHCVHPGPGHFLADGQRDRAGACAQVGHHRGGHVHLAQPVDGPAGHHLGLRARHEHAGAHVELEVAEVRPAGDVLERLARRAARDVGPEPRVEVGVWHHVQLASPDVVHAGRDQFGVRPRRFHSGVGQPQRGQCHLIKQQAHHRPRPPAWRSGPRPRARRSPRPGRRR
jgi:hypothetical protein